MKYSNDFQYYVLKGNNFFFSYSLVRFLNALWQNFSTTTICSPRSAQSVSMVCMMSYSPNKLKVNLMHCECILQLHQTVLCAVPHMCIWPSASSSVLC